MKVHALARMPHHMDHIRAVHQHLSDGLRGETVLEPQLENAYVKHWDQDDIVMVAGYLDIAAARGRRVIYVEHGAGQSYVNPSGESGNYYHGGNHPENVVGYIGPRQDVIDSWGRPGFAAGSPICDPYELFSPERVAAITMHWNGAPPNMVGVPEAGTAFEHYHPKMRQIVATLQDDGWEVVGHRHPRFTHLLGYWKRLGIREVEVEEVRTRAQLLICDNTSLAYECAYTGRSVISLNCPEYRREVEHGLRFWSHAPGLQVNSPEELIDVIPEVDSGIAAVPPALTEYVYGKAYSDGHDGERGAMWVEAFVSSM